MLVGEVSAKMRMRMRIRIRQRSRRMKVKNVPRRETFSSVVSRLIVECESMAHKIKKLGKGSNCGNVSRAAVVMGRDRRTLFRVRSVAVRHRHVAQAVTCNFTTMLRAGSPQCSSFKINKIQTESTRH